MGQHEKKTVPQTAKVGVLRTKLLHFLVFQYPTFSQGFAHP